jgi:hypothetical protein
MTQRWRWGFQPYAPVGRPLPSRKFLVLISVRGWVDSRAQYLKSGDIRFESRPGHWLYRNFSWKVLSPSRLMPQVRPRPLPTISFPFDHSSFNFPFEAIYYSCWLCHMVTPAKMVKMSSKRTTEIFYEKGCLQARNPFTTLEISVRFCWWWNSFRDKHLLLWCKRQLYCISLRVYRLRFYSLYSLFFFFFRFPVNLLLFESIQFSAFLTLEILHSFLFEEVARVSLQNLCCS